MRGRCRCCLRGTAGGDLVIRVGGGPQDSVVFAAGNYSWSKQVNKGGGCNASVFDYRVGDCVVLTPAHFDALLDFGVATGSKIVFGISAMYGTCCVRYDDQRTMYGTGHCEGVDLRTCDWHPQNRHCVVVGNKKCRPWDSRYVQPSSTASPSGALPTHALTRSPARLLACLLPFDDVCLDMPFARHASPFPVTPVRFSSTPTHATKPGKLGRLVSSLGTSSPPGESPSAATAPLTRCSPAFESCTRWYHLSVSCLTNNTLIWTACVFSGCLK